MPIIYETSIATYFIGHYCRVGSILLSQQVVAAGDKAAGGGGAVLPIYFREFLTDHHLYRPDSGHCSEVVWSIICYFARLTKKFNLCHTTC
jgi:hypothetical protein